MSTRIFCWCFCLRELSLLDFKAKMWCKLCIVHYCFPLQVDMRSTGDLGKRGTSAEFLTAEKSSPQLQNATGEQSVLFLRLAQYFKIVSVHPTNVYRLVSSVAEFLYDRKSPLTPIIDLHYCRLWVHRLICKRSWVQSPDQPYGIIVLHWHAQREIVFWRKGGFCGRWG